MNILITSAGQRVSLVESFKKELADCFKDSNVFTTDLNPKLSPACQVSDKFFKVPRVIDDEYIDCLLKICLDNYVKLVIPTIDTELKILSLNVEHFKKHNIDIVVSDYSLVEVCRDKREVNKLFINHNIDIPKQFDINDLVFPVFVKPCDGSRSEGIFIAATSEDINDEHINNSKLMFMEYISDNDYDEFTVDCYYDKYSHLKCVVPRKRIVVRAGEVSKGVTKNNFIVSEFQKNLSKLEGAKGCLTIQVFLHKKIDKIKGIEINPRFGGGYPLTYLSGANYTRWLIEEYLLDKSIESFNGWKENLLMLRYDAEILVEDYEE